MLLLKTCPHCRGDLVLDDDRGAAYLYCVQCAHVLSTAEELKLGVRATRLGILHIVRPAPALQRAPVPAAR